MLYRLQNGFYSGSVDFRSRIQKLGWVGLEPTTNALKGRNDKVVRHSKSAHYCGIID